MSRKALVMLLVVFAGVLIFGYSAVIPTSNEPRDVPTNTPGPSGGDGGDGQAAAGRAIYQGQCAACHSTDGSTSIGPTWQGLPGSEIQLADGSTVTADEAYITESIREPGAKVHNGFQALMPPFDLSDEEIASVIAYMETLE
jgi:cytochrome c oxidase subunit 2